MRFTERKNIVMLSAEVSILTPSENQRRTDRLYGELRQLCRRFPKLSFMPATGAYNGVQEQSFVACFPDDYTDAARILDELTCIAEHYGQESILVRSWDVFGPRCTLLFISDGRHEVIGSNFVRTYGALPNNYTEIAGEIWVVM